MIYKRIVVYDTGRKRTSNITRKFAQGINESETKWIAESRPIDNYHEEGLHGDIAAVATLGILRGTGLMLQDAASKNISRYYIDHAYFNPGYGGKCWLRICHNRHTMNWTMETGDDPVLTERLKRRWKEHFKRGNQVAPWRSGNERGENILICPPTDAIKWYFKEDNWVDTIIAQLKEILNENDWKLIRIRNKPHEPVVDKLGNLIRLQKNKGDISLEEDLENANVVISYNSMVSLTALKKGIPVITSKHNCCYPVSFKLEDLTEPECFEIEPNRAALFRWLSGCQYNLSEIRDGRAWKNILEHQKNASHN